MSEFIKNNKELMKAWDFEKNKDIDIDNITSGSSKKVWWICPQGHSHSMRVSQKAKGQGCIYCLNRKLLVGYNDLKFHNTELLKEWDYEKIVEKSESISYNSSR